LAAGLVAEDEEQLVLRGRLVDRLEAQLLALSWKVT
jgi:hypothetical protein